MTKFRFRYIKTGKAKYISHLDLMATMQRSFLRAGLKLEYSKGFNPHPYISVALPLPVGSESICELMDVGLKDDVIPNIKDIKLPVGISIVEVYKPARKFNEAAWIDVEAEVQYTQRTFNDIIEKLKQHFMQKNIVISKKSKRGYKDIDIIPYIKDMSFYEDKGIYFRAKISAQNPTLNASDLENAFGDDLKPDGMKIKRIEIYDSSMILFK